MRKSLWAAGLLVLGLGLGVVIGRSSTTRVAGGGSPAPVGPPSARAPDAANPVYRVPVDDSPLLGPDDALVTIVESSDFQCPFCKRTAPVLKELQKAYPGKVRLVFKHNPLSFHDRAHLAAVAAEEARVQGGPAKFWEMHDALFELSPALDRPNLEAAAGKLGLDVSKFRAGLESGAHDARIARDQTLVVKLGAAATPSFFVNGRLLVGAQTLEGFKAIVDEELRKADERVRSGTSPKALYAAIIENGATSAPPPPPAPPAASKIPLRPDDPVRGPALAKVTIALFSDFQCPFCARVEPTLKQLQDTYGKDVRIVWKHQPLPFHPNARPAALAAEAAREQGKFWQMHDLMFAAQQELSPAKYEVWATQLKLDLPRFRASLASSKARERIDEDSKLATSVGATGTPTMFVNCKQSVGAKPLEELKQLVDAELARANALLASGARLDAGFYERVCDENLKSVVAAKPAAGTTLGVSIRPDDPARGNPSAPVTVVSFSDFQCPFCAMVEPTLARVSKEYGDKVRFVWKHQPLSIHPNALPAAIAAEAARQQGKFWQMHDKMFANQSALSAEAYERWAGELGLDLGKFRGALQDPRTRARVLEDAQLGGLLGSAGTPTFFINGERLAGAAPFEQFKSAIDRQLNRTAQR
ncbi:MAG TPA: thioredoxin domain-containing protein [Myxococcaceae bacterium]|nr:thioredoxin domain-containing protein [Myxococcaceae bacterium]